LEALQGLLDEALDVFAGDILQTADFEVAAKLAGPFQVFRGIIQLVTQAEFKRHAPIKYQPEIRLIFYSR
jgi:cation transport ATPase